MSLKSRGVKQGTEIVKGSLEETSELRTVGKRCDYRVK